MTLTKESFHRKIDSLIRSAGFAFICVGPEEGSPGFAYTIGLTETYGCSELLIFGVGQQIADVVFHAVANRIKEGARFKDGDVLVEALNLPCTVKAVSREAVHLYALNVWSRYEGAPQMPTFQQIVYPDRNGVFPWEAGYEESMRQIQTELWTRKVH